MKKIPKYKFISLNKIISEKLKNEQFRELFSKETEKLRTNTSQELL